tara:strand:- start:74 stop:1651 length:1578 start_codon:yes stop_codon:yes gene_type:complete
MQIKRRAPRKHGGGSQVDDSGPNPKGSYGRESMRHPFDPDNTPTRGAKEKIPDELLQDLRRRIAEVKLAELIRAAEDTDKPMDLAATIKEASKKKYGGLIDAARLEFIHADPGKYINQLGIDPADLKTGDKLPSVSDLRKYVRNSLDSVAGQVSKLNKYLFPEGIPLDKIVRSIHFGHGQGLGAGGAHFAAEGLAQPPRDNIKQGSGSGPSGGALENGRFKVHDAYSAIGHPQFWDEVLSNFVMGRKHVPVLVELTPEGKNKVVHRGFDVDQIMIEEGEINLRDAVTGETKVRVDPASEADPLHDYGRTHQPKVLESSERNLTQQRPQDIVEVKPQDGGLSAGDQETLRAHQYDPDDRKGGSGTKYRNTPPPSGEAGILRHVGFNQNQVNALLKGGEGAMDIIRTIPEPTRRLLKGLPVPIVGAVMSELDVAQRQEDYNQSGNIVDQVQLGISNIGKAGEYLSSYSAAAMPAVAEDPYAVIPAAGMAIGEGIGVVSELANTTIDFGEAVYNAGQDLVNWLNKDEN